MGCPYISKFRRLQFLKFLYNSIEPNNSLPSVKELLVDIAHIIKNPWFVNWNDVDLFAVIERRQLHGVY